MAPHGWPDSETPPNGNLSEAVLTPDHPMRIKVPSDRDGTLMNQCFHRLGR